MISIGNKRSILIANFCIFAIIGQFYWTGTEAYQSYPDCSNDCLDKKLDIIVNKLNQLENKVNGLNSQGQLCRKDLSDLQQKFVQTQVSGRPTCPPNTPNPCIAPGFKDVEPISYHCDTDRWIGVLKRFDGSVKFHNRNWVTYQHGFKHLDSNGEFFLGLQNLHAMTSGTYGPFEMRIDLEDFDGAKRSAHYSEFSVGNEGNGYRLGPLGQYTGDAGDSFRYHEGQAFTTLDRDNDAKEIGSCGEQYNSAGWFKSCLEANLMGNYLKGEHSHFKEGMYWETFRGPEYSLKSLKMFIRSKC